MIEWQKGEVKKADMSAACCTSAPAQRETPAKKKKILSILFNHENHGSENDNLKKAKVSYYKIFFKNSKKMNDEIKFDPQYILTLFFRLQIV